MEYNTSAIRQAVQNLCPGETIVWTGQPNRGLRFTSQDWFVVPVSLLWGGFALFVIPWGAGVPILFALAFKIVGLYLIAGRFVVDMIRRSMLQYGLTDRSAVILSSFMGGSKRVVDLWSAPEISLRSRGGDEGSIYFDILPTPFDRNNFQPWGAGPSVPAFEFIPDAQRVYQLALGARSARQSPYKVAQ
jgi:hypothetical protein